MSGGTAEISTALATRRLPGDSDVNKQGTAISQQRVMCWRHEILSDFVAEWPDVRLALQRSVGYELQRILDTALDKLPSGKA